jgi:hypothetical protein
MNLRTSWLTTLDGSRPFEYAAVCQNPIDVSPDPKRDQLAREAKGIVAL